MKQRDASAAEETAGKTNTPDGLRTKGYLSICEENRILDEFTSVQIWPVYWKTVSNHQNKMNFSSVVN